MKRILILTIAITLLTGCKSTTEKIEPKVQVKSPSEQVDLHLPILLESMKTSEVISSKDRDRSELISALNSELILEEEKSKPSY